MSCDNTNENYSTEILDLNSLYKNGI